MFFVSAKKPQMHKQLPVCKGHSPRGNELNASVKCKEASSKTVLIQLCPFIGSEITFFELEKGVFKRINGGVKGRLLLSFFPHIFWQPIG